MNSSIEYPDFCTNEIHKLAWELCPTSRPQEGEFFSFFINKFLPIITNRKFLKSHLYFDEPPKELIIGNFDIALWSQGILEVQAAKASLVKEVFQHRVPLKGVSFISIDKISLLDMILPQIKKEGYEFIMVIDDYAKNLQAAKKKLINHNFEHLLFRKQRPERVNKENITNEFSSFLDWFDFCPDIPENKKTLLLLDIDGVCFNSTSYAEAIQDYFL